MLASQLQAEQFKDYPPQAEALVSAHIALLRRLPTIFVTFLLREIIGYDWQFPAERDQMEQQLAWLGSMNRQQLRLLLAKFAQIRMGPELAKLDWVKDPRQFSQQLSTYLWSTHQIDALRSASIEYMAKLREAVPARPPRTSRLGIAVIGRGVTGRGVTGRGVAGQGTASHGVGESDFHLFRKLRPHGLLFTQVKPENGLETLVKAVSARAAKHPLPYRHWCIGGGAGLRAGAEVSSISYGGLRPARMALLRRMRAVVQSGNGGPELMESTLAKVTPRELGMKDAARNGVLDRFQVKLLAEGSGTQIFSTTFVQWAAREALRRAEPLTLLARFTPRQRERPMNELLQGKSGAELDPEGSLVDADMGSYLIWIDLDRLANPKPASFLVWFEDHQQALGIGPALPRGTESGSPADLGQILEWIS